MKLLKRLLLCVATLPLLAGVCAAKDAPDWENEQVIGINKEAAHATLVPYADAK